MINVFRRVAELWSQDPVVDWYQLQARAFEGFERSAETSACTQLCQLTPAAAVVAHIRDPRLQVPLV